MACNFKEASDCVRRRVNRLAGVSAASLEASRDIPDGTHWINDNASSLWLKGELFLPHFQGKLAGHATTFVIGL
jgi:hypothetical protein